MRTKRLVGQLVMMAALTVMTEGVMPAPICDRCRWAVMPNIHTYAEQSSTGNPLTLLWVWVQSLLP